MTSALFLLGWIALMFFIAACFRAAGKADEASEDDWDKLAKLDGPQVPRGLRK